MGCVFEIFIEMLIEGILNLVMFVYLKLAHVLVPTKKITKKNGKQNKKRHNDDFRPLGFNSVLWHYVSIIGRCNV
jgi:hypothetical protein